MLYTRDRGVTGQHGMLRICSCKRKEYKDKPRTPRSVISWSRNVVQTEQTDLSRLESTSKLRPSDLVRHRGIFANARLNAMAETAVVALSGLSCAYERHEFMSTRSRQEPQVYTYILELYIGLMYARKEASNETTFTRVREIALLTFLKVGLGPGVLCSEAAGRGNDGRERTRDLRWNKEITTGRSTAQTRLLYNSRNLR